MSKIKNGGLDQYGKVQSLNGIGGEWVSISRGVFYCRLKTFLFSNVTLHNHLSLIQTRLLEFDHLVFSSHWRR